MTLTSMFPCARSTENFLISVDLRYSVRSIFLIGVFAELENLSQYDRLNITALKRKVCNKNLID